MNIIMQQSFDKERALYGIKETKITDCSFSGPEDGESVLKEARDIIVEKSNFSLRYPLWHVKGFKLDEIVMDEFSRAPIWYSSNGIITHTQINSIKAIRECNDISLADSEIESPEFGWMSQNINIKDSKISGEYLFLKSDNVTLDGVKMSGKYSFQYMSGLIIRDSILDTKDAFWHSENVTVENSLVKGEYLGWFSKNLTLINCHIIGTQPFCYCEGLKLVDCIMEDTDLAFEYSEVNVSVKGHIHSVKNPKSGLIIADSVGEVIMDDAVMECKGEVRIRNND